MREITHIEICNETEIRFLRSGDYQYVIENVEKFMQAIKEYALFDDEQREYLDELGLEAFHKEFDFKNTLNMLDRYDVKVLQKYSERIN